VSNHLSVRAAAKRVKRSTRTIERWIADGLLDVIVVRNAQGKVLRRYLVKTDLLTVYRAMLKANPNRPKDEE
jgi:predicted site-specific integrase-resolvase